MNHDTRRQHPQPAQAQCPGDAQDDRPRCLACGGPGVEKKQKWFCQYCGRLIVTCCD